MAAPKSLLKTVAVTVAERRHTCRHNEGHVILKGDKRLTVTEDRSKQHYCLTCARSFIARDLGRLGEIQSALAD